MICKECKAEGNKSQVYPGHGSTTAMWVQPFYDEDGKYHHHDGNTTTYSYSCSNGHEWTESSIGSCWCGWPEKEDTPSGGTEVPVSDESDVEITSKDDTNA